MSHYRLYFTDPITTRIVAAQDIEAADDQEAFQTAQRIVTDKPVEIWCGTRKVGCCERLSADIVEHSPARRLQEAEA